MAVVICECGTEHADDDPKIRLKKALGLVETAYMIGADIVKFQCFMEGQPLFCPMQGDAKRWKRWHRTILGVHSWRTVLTACRDNGMKLVLSTFQHKAVDMCNQYCIPQKVAVRALYSFPYQKANNIFAVSQPKGQNIVSAGKYRLSCAPGYPCDMKEAVWDGTMDGISDHSGNPFPCVDALLRGARCVEAHLVVSEDSPDAKSGMDAEHFKMICEARDAAPLMR